MDSVEKNWMHNVDLALRGPKASEGKGCSISSVFPSTPIVLLGVRQS
jgi:hypothetical protein